MEHNEYSVYKLKCEVSHNDGHYDDFRSRGIITKVIYLTLVAPTDEKLALTLIEYSQSHRSYKKEDFKIMEFTKEPLDAVIRFEDAYRARF